MKTARQRPSHPPAALGLLAGRQPTAPLTMADVDLLASARLSGLVSVAIADGAQIERAARLRHEALSLHAEATHAQTARVLRALRSEFEAAEVPLRVVKGAANAWLYPPGARGSSDIDVWIAPGEWPRAGRALARLGLAEARCAAIGRLVDRGRPPHEFSGDEAPLDRVDTHFNPFGLLTTIRDVPSLAAQFQPTGAGLLGPSPELALVVAAVNVARKRGRIDPSTSDAARLLAVDLDWETVRDLCRHEGLTSLVGATLHRLCDELDLVHAVPLAADRDWNPGGALECLRLDGRRFEALRALAGWVVPSTDLSAATARAVPATPLRRWTRRVGGWSRRS